MSYYCGYFCALQILYDLFGESKNNDKNLFFFLCFCWEERKLFYFIQQDYRNGGFYTIESLTDYSWKLYSSRYTDLSLNQPIKPNRPGRESYIRTLSKSSSTTFSNISKPILSLTCRKLSGNILSLFTITFSLFLFNPFQLTHFFPEKGGNCMTLPNFFWIFFCFFILFLTSVGFYSLLDFISFN